jgi:pyruvate kinase
MRRRDHSPAEDWDPIERQALIDELATLRSAMLDAEKSLAAGIRGVDASYHASARNLAHYLALRSRDLRPLQERLARLGLSSLGRAEAHTLANLDKALGILHRLQGLPWRSPAADEPIGIESSRALLDRHATALLGEPPADRHVRIMVTLPAEAAHDYGLIRQLVDSGMDIARINCAHDDPAAWQAMARYVRRAAKSARRSVRILMDLAGPKLRTEPLPPAQPVLKLKPQRDEFGRVVAPVRVGLYPLTQPLPIEGACVSIGVAPDWLSALRADDRLSLVDARGARREFRVVRRDARGALIESSQTSYLTPETRIRLCRKKRGERSTPLDHLPARPGSLRVARGDTLRLVRPEVVEALAPHALAIGCSLPEIFTQVNVGERIWFDDGRIGGVIRRIDADGLTIEITHARAGGEKLVGDKGINLPDSQLDLPALTAKDIADLTSVAALADIVGLSFAQRASDVTALRSHLQRLGAHHLGVILKIETRRAFERLPELLYAAMASPAAGIMIARGDLAVECGYERLAEVQEEILWAAEAAHMPVVWATQVLETLAKTGRPSRAEITDAAMGERAECVMLNKGPFIVDAVRTLDDILKRMQQHQAKKRALLRALSSWRMAAQDERQIAPPANGT